MRHFERMKLEEAKEKIDLYMNCPATVEVGDVIYVRDEFGRRRVQVI